MNHNPDQHMDRPNAQATCGLIRRAAKRTTIVQAGVLSAEVVANAARAHGSVFVGSSTFFMEGNFPNPFCDNDLRSHPRRPSERIGDWGNPWHAPCHVSGQSPITGIGNRIRTMLRQDSRVGRMTTQQSIGEAGVHLANQKTVVRRGKAGTHRRSRLAVRAIRGVCRGRLRAGVDAVGRSVVDRDAANVNFGGRPAGATR